MTTQHSGQVIQISPTKTRQFHSELWNDNSTDQNLCTWSAPWDTSGTGLGVERWASYGMPNPTRRRQPGRQSSQCLQVRIDNINWEYWLQRKWEILAITSTSILKLNLSGLTLSTIPNLRSSLQDLHVCKRPELVDEHLMKVSLQGQALKQQYQVFTMSLNSKVSKAVVTLTPLSCTFK